MTKQESLAKARAAKRGVGVKLRTPIQIWEEDKTSLRKAVNAKCWHCSNCQREEITHCTVTSCPLFFVRPYQIKGE
jgi:hypothetical protein